MDKALKNVVVFGSAFALLFPYAALATQIPNSLDETGAPQYNVPVGTDSSHGGNSFIRGGGDDNFGNFNGLVNYPEGIPMTGDSWSCGSSYCGLNILESYEPTTTVTINSFKFQAFTSTPGALFGARFYLQNKISNVIDVPRDTGGTPITGFEADTAPTVVVPSGGDNNSKYDSVLGQFGTTTTTVNLSASITVDTDHKLLILFNGGDPSNRYLITAAACFTGVTGASFCGQTLAPGWDVGRPTNGFPETTTQPIHSPTGDAYVKFYAPWVVLDTEAVGGLPTGTSSPPFATGTLPVIATTTCGITTGEGITGCMQNAFAWAVNAPSSSYDQFTDLIDRLKRKPPMGYLFSTFDAFSMSTTSATTTMDVSAFSFIFTPLRATLVYIFYMFGAVWFFRRVKEIHI